MLFIKFWYFNYDCVVQRTFFQQIFEGLNVKYKLFDSSFCVPYFHRFYALQRTRAAYKFYSDGSELAEHWSIALAKIYLVSLYLRFLWYFSVF